MIDDVSTTICPSPMSGLVGCYAHGATQTVIGLVLAEPESRPRELLGHHQPVVVATECGDADAGESRADSRSVALSVVGDL